jgi:aspartate/methionine/tyrosine aminotransferase
VGPEIAFAVSAEAAAFAAAGNEVYPFHLGDLNIATPENIVGASFKVVRDGKTGYSPNAGIAPLREASASQIPQGSGPHRSSTSRRPTNGFGAARGAV